MTLAGLLQKTEMVQPERALPGRDEPLTLDSAHFVSRRSMVEPFPEGHEKLIFGMGCFWGAEKRFWSLPGVYVTAVGYSAGYTSNPTYEEVCSGKTGHNEVVMVIYNPGELPIQDLLKMFWESHDPTQGMRQGNDIGTQYRSGIYYFTEAQKNAALKSMQHFQAILDERQLGNITTEIQSASPFYYAEQYHQQYLAKNPNGYCGLGGLGISCS